MHYPICKIIVVKLYATTLLENILDLRAPPFNNPYNQINPQFYIFATQSTPKLLHSVEKCGCGLTGQQVSWAPCAPSHGSRRQTAPSV